MIEGYNIDGVAILINPREVVEVYAGRAGCGFWCNVKMSSGTLHRFTGSDADKVHKALRMADLG